MSQKKKRAGLKGEANVMWKGGRSVASNGYVLLRVGEDHHLADVRGYAYEHRVIAEQKLGRRLEPGEVIHHINGDRQDNRPENLEVYQSAADHMVNHRKRQDMRLPGEENPTIECGCGCGRTFLKFDSVGRPRRYIVNHNPPQPAPTINYILDRLEDGPKSLRDLEDGYNGSTQALRGACSKMTQKGLIKRVGRGTYGRKD